MILFNFLKSIQNLVDPSFFFTSTIGEAHGLFDFLIIPFFNMVSISFLIVSFSLCENLLNLCLIGFSSPVSIVCFTFVVFPKSFLFLANISKLFLISLSNFSFCSSVSVPILNFNSFSSFFSSCIFQIYFSSFSQSSSSSESLSSSISIL